MRAKVAHRSAALLPPATAEQARRLATLGEVVLDRLPAPALPLHHPTVVLAMAVGGSIALEYLGRVAALTTSATDDEATEMATILMRPQGSFPTQAYGTGVLSRLRLPEDMIIDIDSRDEHRPDLAVRRRAPVLAPADARSGAGGVGLLSRADRSDLRVHEPPADADIGPVPDPFMG